jgi:LPS-assembly protein
VNRQRHKRDRTQSRNVRLITASCVCLFVSGLIASPVQAAEDAWALCAPSPAAKPVSSTQSDSETSFSADTVSKEGAEYHLQGKVIGQRGEQRIEAQRLFYNEQTEQARAEGDVRYQVGERLLTSDTARLDMADDTGLFSPARFWLTDKHIRGRAETVELQSQTVTELQRAQFTTCDEGDNAWLLRASSLRLDTEENEGIARHARIEFMHVPIFYFPYLSFPLQGRKTGFLVPSFGESSVAGSELTVPWYWNIAPDRDATITPRFMTKRGVLLEGEFRYLNERSAGQLDVAHLSDDRVYEDDRSALQFQHTGDPAPGWRTRVDYRYASDNDYLDDFGNSLSTASVTHLERRGELNYQSDRWRAGLLVQGYQTLDDSLAATSRPYQRLPQLQLAISDWLGPAGLQMGFSAEAVKFARAEGVVGTRLDLQPHISWPLRGAPGFLVPKLTFRHTQYALEKNDPNTDANATRSLPLFSLDSGLVFERELSLGRARRQTLEPRLFYLYVPKKDQADLIVDESGSARVFDSSKPLFSFAQLFRENRFNGGDRVGDANQLSSALSTRFFDEQGRELFSASLGRIFYFRDREVTLPGGTVQTDNASNWVAEMRSQWTSNMSARAALEWNTKDSELDRGTLDWRYQQGPRQMLRLAYRFEREVLKQVDVAAIWPITRHWHGVGRWLRSIRDQSTLETLAGLEYESCCWAARIVQRRHRDDVSVEEMSDSIWLQLELKGLTSVGRKVENLLARDILAP